MKLHRQDALGLEGFLYQLGGLGHKGVAAQLGEGVLQASIQTGGVGSVFGVRMTVDRRFLFIGDQDPSMSKFCIMEPGSMSWYHGAHSTGNDICGFNTAKTFTDCSWVGAMLVIYIPTEPFKQRLLAMGAPQAVERMETVNALEPDPAAVATFQRLFNQLISGTMKNEDQILDFIALQLLAATPRERPQQARNWQLLSGSIWGLHRQYDSEPLTVTAWAQGLNMHETTLRASCKERFNLTPQQLHRIVRLTQAYAYLEDGTKKVDQAMELYRFRNRGEFAKSFRQHFGCNPSALCTEEPLRVAPQQLELVLS